MFSGRKQWIYIVRGGILNSKISQALRSSLGLSAWSYETSSADKVAFFLLHKTPYGCCAGCRVSTQWWDGIPV